MLKPEGRVIMVSGANRGIGAAVAARLYDAGYDLALGARDPETLGPFLDGRDGGRILCHRYDAEDKASHIAWVSATAARFGRIDGLVNNAGISVWHSVEDDDEAALDRMWAVNVKAPLSMIRNALPHLRASGAGRVVNFASLSGKRVKNSNAGYAMTKFAMVALSHATRQTGWEDGVRCTVVCPGFVDTDMTSYVEHFPREKMTAPEDIAELVALALGLPNNASVAELLVNCQREDML
jgi:NADP-dependent 3-hydroxy acid dehydrogenase YdfG